MIFLLRIETESIVCTLVRITDSLAFLAKDDITLKAFIEGLYYGLHNNFPEHFILFKDYLKHRKQFVVDYSRKGKFKVINFEEELLSNKVTLIELGFVTSSVLLITMKRKLESQLLFDKIPSSYILDSDDNPLEYNISSRTLEAVDSSDIEILPPGDIPEKDERTLADILIPTVLSTGGMIGVRAVMSKSASSSGMGGMMWMMTAATGVMTLVTSTYNYFKQGAIIEHNLVLVVDEFTELKRFSSESNDVDFIAEITTIARVGRTLGFHIILVSQNIEGAIYQVSTNFCAVGFLPSFYQKSSDLRFLRFPVIARFLTFLPPKAPIFR